MIIRRFVVTTATEDSVSTRAVEDALENSVDLIPGAIELNVILESERKTNVDQGVDPMNTIEESDQWIRLANKELQNA